MRGSPEDMAAEVQKFAGIGVTNLALWLGTTDPGEVATRAERFVNDVVPLLDGGRPD
jgi:hypothetical protein